MNKKTQKKMIFITARLPYPATSGRKNVMYNYCKILHEHYNYKIVIVAFLEEKDEVEPKPDFIDRVYVLPRIKALRKVINLLTKTFLHRRFPMQVSLYYHPKHQLYIDKIVKKENPDFIMADMVRTTEYVRNYKIFKVADLDDMLSIRYQRQSKMDLKTINPYGAYLFSQPKIVQKILSVNIIKRKILNNEIDLLYKYEREISKQFDNIVFVAQREADILNHDLKSNKALAIPLGVDIGFFSQFFGTLHPEKHTIAFLGAMSVSHNEAGVYHFIKNIFPHIVKTVPDTRLFIVGGGVSDKLGQLAAENIIFTGRVDDVRTVVGKCEVFVCPLTFGSGIKTKNLEAMAMGVPVVTTSIGAENINAANGQDWYIADDDHNFAEKTIALMNDHNLRSQVRDNAYSFVKNNFTWEIARNKFGTLLDNIN